MGKLQGIIRRLVPERGWAIATVYVDGVGEPQKYFIHAKRFVNEQDFEKLTIGSRVSFMPGPPRDPHERPAAFEIEIAMHPGQQALAGKRDNGGAL